MKIKYLKRLIVGGGLVDFSSYCIVQKNYKVLLIENNTFPNDQRTCSKCQFKRFLKILGIWQELEIEQEPLMKL